MVNEYMVIVNVEYVAFRHNYSQSPCVCARPEAFLCVLSPGTDIWVLTLCTRAKACFTENESFSRKNGDCSFFPGEEFAKFNKLLILYHFMLIILSLDINYALIETAIWRMEFFLYYFILPIFFTEKWYLKVRIHTFYRDYVRKVLSSINSE